MIQGQVAGVEVQFLNKEGEGEDENGEPIVGKTKEWVVTREISVEPGDPSTATPGAGYQASLRHPAVQRRQGDVEARP